MTSTSTARRACVPILAILILAACASVAALAADDPTLAREPAATEPAGGPAWSARAAFRGLSGDEMQDAYGQAYGASFQGGSFFSPRTGWRLEVGLLVAVGEPAVPDPAWTVEASEMQTFAAPVSLTVIHRLSPRSEGFVPHVGAGLGGCFGFERTSVELAHASLGRFDWNDTRYRSSFHAHVLAGGTFGLAGEVRGLLEVRWTQAGKGSPVEQSFSAEEIAQGWEEVAAAVRRPDWNLTGWSVSLGATW